MKRWRRILCRFTTEITVPITLLTGKNVYALNYFIGNVITKNWIGKSVNTMSKCVVLGTVLHTCSVSNVVPAFSSCTVSFNSSFLAEVIFNWMHLLNIYFEWLALRVELDSVRNSPSKLYTSTVVFDYKVVVAKKTIAGWERHLFVVLAKSFTTD